MTRDRAIFYINSDIAFDTKLIQSNGAETKTCRKSGLFPLRIYIYKGTTINQTIYPMLNIGSIALPYEPYKAKQSLTLTDTLRSDKSGETDEIDFARGVRKQRFGKVVYDGSDDERWRTSGVAKRYVVDATIDNAKDWQAPLCTHAIGSAEDIQTSGYCAINSNKNFYIDTDITTLSEWKTLISENPITVIYKLETPIETALTETELNAYRQLHTNKPNTTILSEAEMEVDYVADPKLYIDNKIAELTALTLEG
jgi:hypothetical protein